MLSGYGPLLLLASAYAASVIARAVENNAGQGILSGAPAHDREEDGLSEENRYWFEEVPERQRYWVLVSWGMPPKRAAAGEDLDLPNELVSEAKEIERNVRAEKVFGITPDEARKIRREALARNERMDVIGYAPGVVSDPWWSDVNNRWIHEVGRE